MLVPVVIAVLVAAAQVLPQTSAVPQTPPPAAKTQADAPWPPIGVSRMGPATRAFSRRSHDVSAYGERDHDRYDEVPRVERIVDAISDRVSRGRNSG